MKKILSKLPVFIFCVAFLTGYNYLFDESNSTVGVVLLMGILMFLSSDLGFSPLKSAIMIPILYLVMIFGSHFSLLNPYLGLLINFVSLSVIMIISANSPEKSNFLVGMMGYIFCIGNNFSGVIFQKRVLSVVIISIIIGIVYLVIHKKSESNQRIVDSLRTFDLKNKEDSWKARLVISLTLTMFVCQMFSFIKTMWVCLPILSLLTIEESEYQKRKIARLPATILGCVGFYLIYEILIPDSFHQPLMLILGFGAMFITSYFIKTIYNSFSALTTAVLFISSKEAILLRIVSNLIGIVIAVVIEESRFMISKRKSTELIS